MMWCLSTGITLHIYFTIYSYLRGSGSSLGLEIRYSGWNFFVVFLSSSRLILEQYLKICLDCFFHILFGSSVTDRTTFPRYEICVVRKASLNKPVTNQSLLPFLWQSGPNHNVTCAHLALSLLSIWSDPTGNSTNSVPFHPFKLYSDEFFTQTAWNERTMGSRSFLYSYFVSTDLNTTLCWCVQ